LDVPVRQRGRDVQRIFGCNERPAFPYAPQDQGLRRGRVRRVHQGAFTDLAVFTPGLAQQNGGFADAVGNDVDVHCQHDARPQPASHPNQRHVRTPCPRHGRLIPPHPREGRDHPPATRRSTLGTSGESAPCPAKRSWSRQGLPMRTHHQQPRPFDPRRVDDVAGRRQEDERGDTRRAHPRARPHHRHSTPPAPPQEPWPSEVTRSIPDPSAVRTTTQNRDEDEHGPGDRLR